MSRLWGALAFADVDLPTPLTWAVVKGLPAKAPIPGQAIMGTMGRTRSRTTTHLDLRVGALQVVRDAFPS
jgi:hypothetical protein